MPAPAVREHDLSIELVLLIILGIFMMLFGILLFAISSGDLAYAPNSTYGLFLVLVSLQIITMGKTPFGDVRRSWLVVIAGIGTAVLGMLSCFVLGALTEVARVVAGILLVGGGSALLLQLFLAEGKARVWIKSAGVVRQLVAAAALVYALSVALGLVTLLPGLVANALTAVLLILYGLGFFSLAWCIQAAHRLYPAADDVVRGGE